MDLDRGFAGLGHPAGTLRKCIRNLLSFPSSLMRILLPSSWYRVVFLTDGNSIHRRTWHIHRLLYRSVWMNSEEPRPVAFADGLHRNVLSPPPVRDRERPRTSKGIPTPPHTRGRWVGGWVWRGPGQLSVPMNPDQPGRVTGVVWILLSRAYLGRTYFPSNAAALSNGTVPYRWGIRTICPEFYFQTHSLLPPSPSVEVLLLIVVERRRNIFSQSFSTFWCIPSSSAVSRARFPCSSVSIQATPTSIPSSL